ncbi:MAG TPA: ParB/RepB/Spo0J family partition protein [Terriglobales bacterium]
MAAVEEHKPVEKRRALGRGLDSLLPSGPRAVPPPMPAPAHIPPAAPARVAEIQARADGDLVEQIPLDQIDENPYQTRRSFEPSALAELAESIKANGLAQPVVVRPGANGRYVLVLGERRCRASKLAGKTSVAAIVRHLGNEQAAEMTIVENLQRQDLNCREQAEAFARLSREFNLTQEQIGQRTGVSRESVANYIRLLKLPPSVLELIGHGKLGFSEARVLLEAMAYLDPQGVEILARTAVDQGLTVRDLKLRVEHLANPEVDQPEPRVEKPVDPNVKAAQTELERLLGTRVRINDRNGKGRIVIEYRNLNDFDRVLELLGRA